jgi:hypothetical protein
LISGVRRRGQVNSERQRCECRMLKAGVAVCCLFYIK